MTKVLAQLPDPEELIVTLLTARLAARNVTANVGIIVPTIWKPADTRFVQVGLDGVPDNSYPIKAMASIRLTAWASTTSLAKSLISLCEGLLLSYEGDTRVTSIQSLTGVIPTRDSVTGAQLASIAVRANIRYTVLS